MADDALRGTSIHEQEARLLLPRMYTVEQPCAGANRRAAARTVTTGPSGHLRQTRLGAAVRVRGSVAFARVRALFFFFDVSIMVLDSNQHLKRLG